jgi:2-(1,2-epoxy-1,2-dihydrophenyl)acetyl-CoA isomerase
MPTFDTLRWDRDAAVVTLTMDRPERRNALSPELDRDLRDAFALLRDDEDVRAVVLRGAGGSFCAGADLTILKNGVSPNELYHHLTERYRPLIEAITAAPVPVLGAIGGSAAGAGMALALACDLRVMAEDASLLMAFSSIGFVPDSGASFLLARQVGYSRAFELAAEATPLPADRCLELGLTNRVVPAGGLADAAQEWAHDLAARPTRALGLTKRALHHALTHSLRSAIEYEARLQTEALQTDDHQEGVAAFLEKRDPSFTGS